MTDGGGTLYHRQVKMSDNQIARNRVRLFLFPSENTDISSMEYKVTVTHLTTI